MENTNTSAGSGAGAPKKVITNPADIPSGPIPTPPQKQAEINAELNALLEKMATAPIVTDNPINPLNSPIDVSVSHSMSPVVSPSSLPPASHAAPASSFASELRSQPSIVTSSASVMPKPPVSHAPTAVPPASSSPYSYPSASAVPKPASQATSFSVPQHKPTVESVIPQPITATHYAAPAPKAPVSSIVPPRPAAPASATYVAPQPHVSKVEFAPDPLAVNRTYVSSQTTTSDSSHKMLWLMVILTMLVLAAIGGVAYWYLKIYTPALLADPVVPVATTTSNSAFPSATKPAVKSTSTPYVPVTSKPQAVTAFTAAERQKVAAYISANINALAPRKSSQGYSVTDIVFDGPDRAVVDYGNASVSYSAVVVAYIDSAGAVHVTSFTNLEK